MKQIIDKLPLNSTKKTALKSKIDHRKRHQYVIDQPVRVIQKRPLFGKEGANFSWSTEIFKIKQILYSNVRYFRVENEQNELMKESYLDPEIRPVSNSFMKLIEKIISRKGNSLQVKYVNMPKGRDTEWINKQDIL